MTRRNSSQGASRSSTVVRFDRLLAPIEGSIALFKASRAASLEIIKRLSVEQLSNAGVHTESGAYDLRKWLTGYTNHPKDHAAQLF